MYSRNEAFKIPIRIALSILIIGSLFKIMHWPFANLVTASMVVAFSLILIFYPLRFWKKRNKLLVDYVKLLGVCAWAIRGVFSILHLNYSDILTLLFFGAWVVLEALNYIKPEQNSKLSVLETIANLIFAFGAVFVIIGFAFKILHWPYANLILIIGLCSAALWFLKDLFTKQK